MIVLPAFARPRRRKNNGSTGTRGARRGLPALAISRSRSVQLVGRSGMLLRNSPTNPRKGLAMVATFEFEEKMRRLHILAGTSKLKLEETGGALTAFYVLAGDFLEGFKVQDDHLPLKRPGRPRGSTKIRRMDLIHHHPHAASDFNSFDLQCLHSRLQRKRPMVRKIMRSSQG